MKKRFMLWNAAVLYIGWMCNVAGLTLQPIPFDSTGAEQTLPSMHVDNLDFLSSRLVPVAYFVESLAANMSDIVSGDIIFIPKDVALPDVWSLPNLEDTDQDTAPLFLIRNEQVTGGFIAEMPSHFLNPTLVEAVNMSSIVTSGKRYFHTGNFRDIQSAIPVSAS
jgi:hypothetical protein